MEGNLFQNGIYGFLGLGFDADVASAIGFNLNRTIGNSNQGRSPLANIFYQNMSLPNFITIMLGRSGDLDSTAEGMLTISEYIEGYEDIENTPKLPVFQSSDGSARWTVLVDGISVNGKSIALNSSSKDVPHGKSIGLLDTGFTQPSFPSYVVDAIYSTIPDAFYDETDEIWIVPCNASTDLRFTLGYVFHF